MTLKSNPKTGPLPVKPSRRLLGSFRRSQLPPHPFITPATLGLTPNNLQNQTTQALRTQLETVRDAHWRTWLQTLFPRYVSSAFAQRHEEFWDWVWSIERDQRPRPFVAVWPRAGAKSTSAELACVAVQQRGTRHYGLYVSETQDQADKHVASIAVPFEEIGVERAVNKYGSSKGWRRNRLRTSDGFTIDSVGLDTASRGIKVEDKRPDFIILDDVDNRHDSKEAVHKKIETITETILPAGSNNCAVLCIQNLVHTRSVFSQLANGMAQFLSDRIISGPFKAIEGFKYEIEDGLIRITEGIATWAGQPIEACQNYIRTWGLRAFLRECQHQVGNVDGALWKHELIDTLRVSPEELIHFTRKVVALDPAATSKDFSDEHGIIVSGCAKSERHIQHGYALADYSLRGTPNECAVRAIAAYILHAASVIVGEGNNGGEWIETVIRGVSRESVCRELVALGVNVEEAELKAVDGKKVNYKIVWASKNKETRAEPISNAYSEGRAHHVGVLEDLEDEMCSWVPGRGRSPNRVDALVWGMTELGIGARQGINIG